ncbi:helix-turn-helix transcriptional regulator [Solwaraspora sp. WMMD406]|uniref:helix-turn-helix domain-containing protein n=1 Tax=Solwaraspora sp. WMMD406 TaxID=3016095 RepID=UPI002417423F|nr:helix-turn-helix transcriptional regulator [Solwaraspora sp. WMMD406]MDG4767565.1 helix-turn-helix transcriptional regulator [Solwaraspora sp. WMMD406]
MSGSEYLISELRRVRESMRLTQESWAERVHFSVTHVGAIERGDRPALPDYLKSVDKAFGTAFVKFYREFIVGEHAPIWLRSFIEYEGQASLIRAFQPLLIPGLLQTEAYARAVLTSFGIHGDAMESAISTRLGRQEIFKRASKPCHLVAVIDEAALHRGAGGPEVMREQLTALAEAAERPNIQVQLVPMSTDVYPGVDGGFMIATVDGRAVGYLETHVRGKVVEAPDDTAHLEHVWETIRGYALPSQQSLELIMRAAEKWA